MAKPKKTRKFKLDLVVHFGNVIVEAPDRESVGLFIIDQMKAGQYPRPSCADVLFDEEYDDEESDD